MPDNYILDAEFRSWRDLAGRELRYVLFTGVCLVLACVAIYLNWNPDEPQPEMFLVLAVFVLLLVTRGFDWFRFSRYARDATDGKSTFLGRRLS